MSARLLICLSLGLSLASGCMAEDPTIKKKPMHMGPNQMPLDPPILMTTPALTPKDTLAVRGTTDGKQIVVKSTQGSVAGTVFPTGSFCLDVPLLSGQPNMLSVYALGGDGRISMPVVVMVTQDSGAAVPSNATCNTTGPVCMAT